MFSDEAQWTAVSLWSTHCFSWFDSQAFTPFREKCGKSGGEGPRTRGGPRFSSVPQCASNPPQTHKSRKFPQVLTFFPKSTSYGSFYPINQLSPHLYLQQHRPCWSNRPSRSAGGPVTDTGTSKCREEQAEHFHGAAFEQGAWKSQIKAWLKEAAVCTGETATISICVYDLNAYFRFYPTRRCTPHGLLSTYIHLCIYVSQM